MANLFNEKLYVIPGAAVATDFDSTPRVSSQSSGVVLLVAESTNGIPYTKGRVYEFSQASDAIQVLKSGPAVDLINCLFSPSPDFSGPEKVLFVRCNDAQRAKLDLIAQNVTASAEKYTCTISSLQDTASYFVRVNVSVAGKATSSFEFIAKMDGEVSNISIQETTGETPDTAKILLDLSKEFNSIEGVSASVLDGSLKIVSDLPLTITDSTKNTCLTFNADDTTRLKYTMSIAAQASKTYDFAIVVKRGAANPDKISDVVVENINKQVGLKAVKTKSGFEVSSLYQNTEFELSVESSATIACVKTPATIAEPIASIYSVDYGQNQDLAFKFEDNLASFYYAGNLLKVVEDVSTLFDLKRLVEADVVLKKYFSVEISTGHEDDIIKNTGVVIPFTVYADTKTDLAAFNAALQITASHNKSTVISQFDAPAYHLAMQTYCNTVSEFECVPVCGGALGETPTQVSERAKALNGEPIICYPGIYLALTEETKLYSPVYFAAKVAGLRAAIAPQTPLTRKTISCLGFEEIDTEGTSMTIVRENLINNGVLFGVDIVDKGYCIDKGINTVQGQNNRQILGVDDRTHEDSIVRIKQQMQKDIRVSAANTFPGTTRLKPSKTDVIDFYRKYFNSKVGTYLTGWDDKTLTVRCVEDAWFGEALLYVNGPINQAFFTLHFALDENI